MIYEFIMDPPPTPWSQSKNKNIMTIRENTVCNLQYLNIINWLNIPFP